MVCHCFGFAAWLMAHVVHAVPPLPFAGTCWHSNYAGSVVCFVLCLVLNGTFLFLRFALCILCSVKRAARKNSSAWFKQRILKQITFCLWLGCHSVPFNMTFVQHVGLTVASHCCIYYSPSLGVPTLHFCMPSLPRLVICYLPPPLQFPLGS